MAFKIVQGWFEYSPSSTPSAAQLESRNGVLLLPQDSVVIDESRRGEKKLGEGTFARVYVGMYSGKERAIKVFNGKSDSIVDKAWEEYEKLNSLKHPNIVRVYGMWEDPHKGRNAPAIVMELCDHSLHDYVEQYYPRGSITHECKLKILHDITSAMVYLHSQTLVHGDLRAPNVLIKRNKDELTAKLTDFGMARVLDPQNNSYVTKSVVDCDYLPPEVFNHKEQRDRKKNWGKLTTQVDVFMFGPVAIELACGEFPKPTPKHEIRKGKVTRTFSEIERREQYLTKVKVSDRAITDVIVKMCLAENPEDRGTFLDLQRIVKGFQRQTDQPGSADHFQDLYEEAQEELEGLRSQMEADQVSLYQQDVEQKLKVEKEELKKENEQLRMSWKSDERKLLMDVESLGRSLVERDLTLKALKEDLKLKEDRYEKLQKILNSSKHETMALGDKLMAVQSELRASQAKDSKLEQLLSRANQAKSTLEKESTLLKGEVQSKERECSFLRSAETRLNKLKQDHENLQQKLRMTVSEVSQLRTEQSTTSSDMKGKDAEIGKKQDSIRQLRDLLQAREADIKRLRHEVKGLNEAIQFSERQLKEERKHKTTSTKLQEMVQQLKSQKEKLEEEITTLKETLSKDGQSRMLAEVHKFVKSELPEQMSAFGKDSAKLQVVQRSQLKDKDELIANLKKTVTEITMTMATKEDIEASIRKLWKEGRAQEEIKVEKLSLQVADLQGQLAEKQTHLDSVEDQLSSLSLEKKNLEDELARQKTTQAGLKEVIQNHDFKQKQSADQIRKLDVMLEKLSEQNQEKDRELQGQLAKLTKLNQRLSIRNTELLALKDKSKTANVNALETISLGSKAPERDLMKHCWLPFGLQTMVVEAEGAPVNLHPPPPAHVTHSEAVLLPPFSLEAPLGCINTEVCSKLYLRYGIVVWGPYSLPEGLQLASVGVYIYFDPAHCVNSLILRIPHWSGSEGQGKVKSVAASLLLQEGGEGEGERYRFEEFGSEGLTVSGAAGSMLFPLPGSGIYCLVQREGAPSRYIASSFETNGTGGSNLDVRFTYHSSVWMQILEKYFPKPSTTVRFQFKEDRLQGQMERTSGGGWRACVVGTGVTEQEQCEYGFAGLKNGRELLSAVQKGVYPPVISCRTEYSSPLRETGARTSAVMVVSGVQGAPLTFGVTTYEYSTVRKSPLGTESDSTPTAQTPPTTAVTVLHPSSVATSPVRVTSSVQATSPVRVTSSVQATRPPVQATLPSTTAENVRQRPSSLAASLVAMIDLDSNEDASSSQNAKRFCLRNLMPFVAPLSQDFEALAHHMHIAGELKERVVVEAEGNRYSQLQKLFTAWLSEGDSEEAPHNWEFFISVVRRIGKPGLAEEIAKLVYV